MFEHPVAGTQESLVLKEISLYSLVFINLLLEDPFTKPVVLSG